MMSIGQKVIALGVMLGMNLVAFLITPLFGVLALAASLPLALVILKR
jgi:hypothetical protein